MNGYTFEISCPTCGGEMEHVTNGVPQACEVRAVAHCPTCRRDAVIVVVMSMAFQPDTRAGEPFPHGTEAGYNRHRRAGDIPVTCEACRQAHSLYMKPKNDARKHRAREMVNA